MLHAVAALLLAPSLTMAAPPQTIAQEVQTQTASAPLQPSSYTDSTFLQRFDPVRGRLLRVDLEYTTYLERNFGLENTGAAGATYDLDQLSTLRATVGLSTPYSAAHDDTRNYSGLLMGFDGTTDFAGPSGITAPPESAIRSTRATSASPAPPLFVTAPELAPVNFEDAPNGGGIFSVILFADSSLSFLTPPAPLVLDFEERVESTLTLTYLYEQGETFCSGDFAPLDPLALNTCTPCPCGNEAPPGTPGGCLNSLGTSAQLVARGRASFSSNSLELRLTGAIPNAQAVLFASTVALPTLPTSPCFGTSSGVIAPILDGLRCLGGGPRRIGTRTCDANGEVGFTNSPWGGPGGGGLNGLGGFFPGQTVLFQAIYREDPTLGCGTGLATSQGRRLPTYL